MTTTRDYDLTADLDNDGRRIPISEARAQLSAVVKHASDGDITLMQHGRPAAVLMSIEHYQALLDELDELQDRLTMRDTEDSPGVPFSHVLAELGLADSTD